MRGGDRSCAFGTLQDRLVNAFALAGITDIEAANAFLREVCLPAHNARFAVPPAGEARPSPPFPASTSTTSCASRRSGRSAMTIASPTARSKLQIPQSPMRPHFVKARVKVHIYADGSHAVSRAQLHRPLRRERNDHRCENAA